MPILMPFREIEALRRELDRALSSEAASVPFAPRLAFLPGRSARTYPLTNVSEDRDTVYVRALAPGLDPEQLDISILRNTLTISGAKIGPTDVPAEAYHRSERAAGRFVRTVDLPTEVDVENVSARYNDGLLTVTLPKAAAARRKQITVTVS